MSRELTFSKAVTILKDIKKKKNWDVIKIIEQLDEKPITFDFGAGNIIVIRYVVETIDARLLLFVPAINSFTKKIKIKKYFEIGAKRTYNYELPQRKTNEWIIYINRIKNLNSINLKLKERIYWQKQPKQKEIEFPFDENWLNKCLPIKNNLDNCKQYFETLNDIDKDTLLCEPLQILRIQLHRQIEVTEPTGSVIKNLEYLALNHKSKIIKLYVPYFHKDLVSNLIEKFLECNIVINKLKVFYKVGQENELYAGFLWDPTLSGFVTIPKTQDQKLLSIKDGEDIFKDLNTNKELENLLKQFTDNEKSLNEFKRQQRLQDFNRSNNNKRKKNFNHNKNRNKNHYKAKQYYKQKQQYK